MSEGLSKRVGSFALWLPSAGWMAVIFRVSAIPGSRIPGGYSTLGHFVAYAILGALLVLPLRRTRTTGESVAIAVVIASVYGITDEFHQAFVPLRTPDVTDWGVDTLGALAGAYASVSLVEVLKNRRLRRRPGD